MKITKEYLKSVQPKKDGYSDKYSWNIHIFLKKHLGRDVKVFENPRGVKVIGEEFLDGISGDGLDSLIRSFKIQEFWFDSNWNLKEQKGWLKEYQRVGRCILLPHDYSWYEGEDTRFTYVNNTRKCNWCGQWQHKKLHKIVKREIKEEWRDDK